MKKLLFFFTFHSENKVIMDYNKEIKVFKEKLQFIQIIIIIKTKIYFFLRILL